MEMISVVWDLWQILACWFGFSGFRISDISSVPFRCVNLDVNKANRESLLSALNNDFHIAQGRSQNFVCGGCYVLKNCHDPNLAAS